MMKAIQFFVALFLITTFTLQAQNPAIKFVQDGKTVKMKKKKGRYVLQLKPAAFTLEYKHKELMLSAGLSKDLFKLTQAKVDAAKDYMSNFYIGKFGAVAKMNDWIYISGDGAMMFSKKTGAIEKKDGTHSMTVNNWYKDELEPLSSYEQVFMTLWLDTNLDLFIDPEESLQVVLKFE